MAPDSGSRRPEPNTAGLPSRAPNGARADRPLGRGLEDISHLFLSQGAGPASREQAWSRSPAPAAPQARAGATVLLRARSDFTKDRLVAALRELDGALEEGLRAIDVSLPCDPWGEIDLVALDRVNRLTIIDVDTVPSDGLLLRGVSHLGWAVRNTGVLRRMYHGQRVDFSLPPRLFLVAPQFPPLLRMVVRQITQAHVSWARFHAVDVSGDTGLFFEQAETP